MGWLEGLLLGLGDLVSSGGLPFMVAGFAPDLQVFALKFAGGVLRFNSMKGMQQPSTQKQYASIGTTERAVVYATKQP